MKSNKNNISIKNTESICNKMSDFKPIYKEIDSSILTYREILLLQPEKKEILDKWFETIKAWPRMNSTPVMDITEMVVYPAYSLNLYAVDPDVRALLARVRKSAQFGEPCGRSYFGMFTQYDEHIFVPVSKIDITILKESLAKYKTNKKKQKTLESLSKALETLQKEIAELKNS